MKFKPPIVFQTVLKRPPRDGTVARGLGCAARQMVAGVALGAMCVSSSLPAWGLPAYGLTASERGQATQTNQPAGNGASQQQSGPSAIVQSPSAAPNAAAPARKLSRRQADREHARNLRDAESAYLAGAKLLEQRDVDSALREFTRASVLAPENRDYLMAAAAMRESHVTELVQQAGKARLLGKDTEAEAFLAQARRLDPGNSILAQHPDPASLLNQISMKDDRGSVTSMPLDAAAQSSKNPSVHSRSANSSGSNSWGANSWIKDGPRLSGPIELQPAAAVHSFHLNNDLEDVLRQVASAYGIKVSFDDSVGHQRVKLDLDDVTYDQAMHVLLGMGTLFAVPLNRTTIVVAKDTEEKRGQLQHLIEETIYLPGDSTTQVTELGNMIRNVFEIKQISVENNLQTIVVRAPNETIRVLNMTLADLLDGGSQVLFDLKLYAIDKALTRSTGATVPTNVGLYNVASAADQLVQANQQVVDQAIAQGIIPANLSNIAIAAALIYYGLATSPLLSGTLAFVGNGLSATGIFSSNLSAQINLALSESETRALDDIQPRVGDREQAVFRAGTKYPITQSTYSTTTPTPSSGLSSATIGGVSVASLLATATTATIPQIQYEDLGVTLKATPIVQLSGQVTLHLDLKIQALQGASINGIPVLTNTSFTSDVTVADGATATLVTNLNTNEASAVTGIPGLSDLPGFQNAPDLLRTTDRSQLVMVLTPHIVRRRPDRNRGPQIPIDVPASVE